MESIYIQDSPATQTDVKNEMQITYSIIAQIFF